ncbi:DUF3037 domain-containing protein [Halpernia frigidisoli]|uniref:DUF3037 domain-containing protein n=1 Tax=Halpernia frigidisoli TaxID=1125876 RepID=A0A1I3FAD4_9FLAO|nr:DUF3037 domain-containing protein [Halpernia frigidisoli]SFI08168.1 Protein of unknown function [Halpernia frigidisoli]
MQEFKLYEYAVIRALPKVEREEFFNVGLILFSKKEKYIHADYFLDKEKLKCFFSEENLEDLETNLKSFLNIAKGEKCGGKISILEIPERFRWLNAVRSSCIQTSRPHVGLSKDLDKTFERLFEEMVK